MEKILRKPLFEFRILNQKSTKKIEEVSLFY